MGQEKYSTKRRKGKHLTYEERIKIEALYRCGLRPSGIGLQLERSKRTIERELKQGEVELLDYQYRKYKSYSAEVSQQAHDLKATAKGSKIKLGKEYGFAREIARHIKEKRSPYMAMRLIEISGEIEFKISLKTLYNYIDSGYIPGITNKDLPEGGRAQKRGYKQVRIALNNTKGTSISERPEEIELRKTFGHWEIDSVEGKKGSTAALFVMSERLTRQEQIYKINNKTQSEIKRIIDKIEKELGSEKFAKTYKTITCDNGCEFLNQAVIESSIINEKQKRTKVYYCHPYSAWERGTNENINRMIRRFIPKGVDIGNYTDEQIKDVQDFINSCPRLVLDGYPSNTRFMEYTA